MITRGTTHLHSGVVWCSVVGGWEEEEGKEGGEERCGCVARRVPALSHEGDTAADLLVHTYHEAEQLGPADNQRTQRELHHTSNTSHEHATATVDD